MGKASRDKGAKAERAVAAWLRQVGWPDTRRYGAGDGRQPGDIDWHPLVCLEVKDRASSSWPTWCRQVVAESRPGQVPAVVRKTAGVTDVSRWEVRVRLAEWCAVLGGHQGHPMVGVTDDNGSWPWVVVSMDELANAVAAVDRDGGEA